MAPISLIMVVWQTNPFWVYIMAYFILSEPVFFLEIIAIMICFAAVGTIASQSMPGSDTEEADIDSEFESNGKFIGLMLGLICAVG